MIEPTATSPGSEHVTLREFEAYQKAQANQDVLIKELVEQARLALEKQTEVARMALEKQVDLARAGLEKQVNQEFAAREKALMLQTQQYDIHLANLNHEQARLLADRERYLQKEVFDPHLTELNKWKDTVNTFMATAAALAPLVQALQERVTTIDRALAVSGGRDRGVMLAWTVGGAAVFLLLAVLTFFAAKGL